MAAMADDVHALTARLRTATDAMIRTAIGPLVVATTITDCRLFVVVGEPIGVASVMPPT
jgi:hypothetical protein